MVIPVIAFVITYILMIALPDRRHWVAAASAVFFVAAGILPASEAAGAIDWNILMMLCGTMGTVYYFTDSGMPEVMAEKILQNAPNVMWAVVFISMFAGIISAFMDNVATVLMIAPIGLAVANELGISPVPMLISIAVSSNLQGAATLVGDTTSIMLGGYAGMSFMDFFYFRGRPGIFWAVELGALATVPVIMVLFKRHRQAVRITPNAKVKRAMPGLMLLMNIVLLITASFFPNRPSLTNGCICLGCYAACALYDALIDRDLYDIKRSLAEIDYKTLLLLASLFVVIAGITRAGVLDVVANALVSVGGGSKFAIYTLIVWGSVLCSAFIDNIPYVATMLPVVTGIAATMGCEPYLFYFGLLTGATLGGNITPIGASANIAAIGILRRENHEVRNKDFMRIGVPFTLVAVTLGYLFNWFVWA